MMALPTTGRHVSGCATFVYETLFVHFSRYFCAIRDCEPAFVARICASTPYHHGGLLRTLVFLHKQARCRLAIWCLTGTRKSPCSSVRTLPSRASRCSISTAQATSATSAKQVITFSRPSLIENSENNETTQQMTCLYLSHLHLPIRFTYEQDIHCSRIAGVQMVKFSIA